MPVAFKFSSFMHRVTKKQHGCVAVIKELNASTAFKEKCVTYIAGSHRSRQRKSKQWGEDDENSLSPLIKNLFNYVCSFRPYSS